MIGGMNQDLGKNVNKEMEFWTVMKWYCECGEGLFKGITYNASGQVLACDKCGILYTVNASCRKTGKKLKVVKKKV